ncbi:MAG: PilZ domain-containing protein [Proteobacteria bacterium]|nr:PilZ domain-containing protein [Pseudomonadota bacterium]
MNNFADERAAPRLTKDVTIFIEIQSTSIEDKSHEDIVICKSLNLSALGLQVKLDRVIPEGRILRLCLDMKKKEPIFVIGEVVWRRQDEDTKDYHVGFKLLDSRGSDLIDWQQAISEIFNE